MKIHAIQNINACLDFIKSKGVKLVGIGAEEVHDEELKLILGMVWTIILRFDIQDISEGEMSAKDALLLWCQRKTKGYHDVNVTNFHKSWQNGLAFCALIHRHRPDLIDFDALDRNDSVGNLKIALDVALTHLDIAQMIDPEDVVASIKPDERSIMTQVAAFYKCFASFNKNEVAASKIATVLKMNQANEKLIREYELMASKLLEWIPVALERLKDRPALNSVTACLDHLKSFKPFRTSEYPAKLQEKALLSAHYSSLQTKLRLSGR
jgi:actinin alpha